MWPKRSIRIEISFNLVIFTNSLIFTNHSLHISFRVQTNSDPWPASQPHTPPFISFHFISFILSFFKQFAHKTRRVFSHLQSFVFCYGLMYSYFCFIPAPYTLQIHNFHPFSCLPSQTNSKYSFQYYTASCIAHLYQMMKGIEMRTG